jgi:hypothetical protein
MLRNMTTLINLLVELREDLKSSNNDAHNHINFLVDSLSKALTKAAQMSVLSQIKSGSKIVDYANFNLKQEKHWMMVWSEATRLLQ